MKASLCSSFIILFGLWTTSYSLAFPVHLHPGTRSGKKSMDLVSNKNNHNHSNKNKNHRFPSVMRNRDHTSPVVSKIKLDDDEEKRLSGVKSVFEKIKGVGSTPYSPFFTFAQSSWVFIGCFSTLLVLTKVNTMLGNDYQFVLVPFGAFLTLLYGVTEAPASQPSNAILGQVLSLSIALLFSHSELQFMDVCIRQSLGTSLAIAGMVKLGITHPPAGAACMAFLSGNFTFSNMISMLIANCIAIVMATVITDWRNDRKYPSYWGFKGYSKRFKKATGISKDTPDNILQWTKDKIDHD